jgi:hypothetical protein
MSTFLAGYDLDKPGQNYAGLEAEIKSLGAWWHNLDSTWLVVSGLSCTKVRDRVLATLDANDKVLVVDVSSDSAAWFGFSEAASQWIKANL